MFVCLCTIRFNLIQCYPFVRFLILYSRVGNLQICENTRTLVVYLLSLNRFDFIFFLPYFSIPYYTINLSFLLDCCATIWLIWLTCCSWTCLMFNVFSVRFVFWISQWITYWKPSLVSGHCYIRKKTLCYIVIRFNAQQISSIICLICEISAKHK